MPTILLFGRLKQENPSEPSLNYITEFCLKRIEEKKIPQGHTWLCGRQLKIALA